MAAKPSKRTATAPRAVLVPFALLLIASLATATTSSPAMQDEEPDPRRMLTFEQNTLYMYGIQTSESPETWETWDHAEPNDGRSDDSFSEDNLLGGGGGGRREFSFDGSDVNNETVGLDTELPITGKLVLSINCNTGCSQQVDIALRMGPKDGGVDLMTQSLEGPDGGSGNEYTFEFAGHRIDEVEAGDVLGLRIGFTKPGTLGEGYTLYLGRDNFEMTIPVLPPYEEEVPGLEIKEGEEYASPYSGSAAGFAEMSAQSSSLTGPILILLLSIAIIAAGIVFLPPIPFKTLSVLLIALPLMLSMTVLPIISGPVAQKMAYDASDPDFWTIDEIAGLDEREGTFLGDDLVADTHFMLYIEYSDIYRARDADMGGYHYGLGFEKYGDTLGSATESTPRGREYVQLYFSLFHQFDPSVASAMIVHVRLVNDTSDPENARIVPQWAVADGEGNQFWEINPELGGRWLIPEKSADGKMVVELIGIPYTWQFYPLFSLIVGFALGGFGFWSWTKARREIYAQDDDDDDDFDFDDDDFDFDDEDL